MDDLSDTYTAILRELAERRDELSPIAGARAIPASTSTSAGFPSRIKLAMNSEKPPGVRDGRSCRQRAGRSSFIWGQCADGPPLRGAWRGRSAACAGCFPPSLSGHGRRRAGCVPAGCGFCAARPAAQINSAPVTLGSSPILSGQNSGIW